MQKSRILSLPEWATAFDTETALRQPGLAAPPLVCGSIAQWGADGKSHGRLLSKREALDEFVAILEHPKRVMVGAFIPYDLLVCAVEWYKLGRDVTPLVYRALDEGRIYDILIGESLGAIADGCLYKDPRTGGDLRDPITNEPKKYYSLEIVTDLRFGRKDAKANDRWRLKYWLLAHIPIWEWPQDARDYPVDDARNTLEDCLAQVGYLPSLNRHVWREGQDTVTGEPTHRCRRCKISAADPALTSECWGPRPCRNLHQMADQVATGWAMHLGASWGFAVDQAAVTEEVRRVEKVRANAAPKLIEYGFLKWKKEKGEYKLAESKGKVARAVAAAYGATKPCAVCGGVGRVPKDKIPTRVAYDPEKHGRGCVACCSTGFDLSTVPDLPRTDPSETYPEGQVKADADTLNESGDEKLMHLAEYKEDAKVVTNYGPYLREAINPDGRSVPLTLWPNVLLETDRTSYADAIQQFPRDGGLRACIVARPGYVLCSCDYNQGEVITHAQSLLYILGESTQAELVLAGKEVHSMFGAKVLNVSYDDFFAGKKKNKLYANTRQACKPFVFGRPGRMGVPKLVQTQRRQGPDTPCPNGPVEVEIEENGEKKMVPGYRGLRFCILMDGAPACGIRKVTAWGRGDYERAISPTCEHCLECAERLMAEYHDLFPETKRYFNFCQDVLDEGQPLTEEQQAIHGVEQLDPGEMCQHVSWIIRGGLKGNDCCNGYFQSLLAVASKRALRIAQRECTDSTIRVPTDACHGGKVSRYAGQVSPLLGSRCIVLQHDEILAELLEHKAHDAAMRLQEIMERAFQEVCPDLAPSCKAPPALMRRWLKSAEPWWERGKDKPADPLDRLVPWEPPPPKRNTVAQA